VANLWLGDMGGDLIVAPALLIGATHYRKLARLPGRPDEAVVLGLLLVAVSIFAFTRSTSIAYVVFPLLIWAALRFWQPGAAFGSFIVATIAVAFTANGKGPYAMSGPDDRLLLAQTFVSVAGVTALVLAAVTSERRRAEESEREISETLQRSLLPDAPPAIDGWEVSALYRPAGAAEVEVGGDFYDFFPTAGGWIAILGDVAGKGVQAAAMAALVRHGARFASQTEASPAAILTRLDDVLRQQPALALCSALCVRIESHRLLVSSAGHPAPLIVRDDGRIREIGGGGPMLGAFTDPTWPERAVVVGTNETVLLYTDGVTDTQGPGDRFGQRRLARFLAEHARLHPGDLLGELEGTLDEFQVDTQGDDTAAIALRRGVSPAKTREARRPSRPRLSVRLHSSQRDFEIETAAADGVCSVRVAGEIDHGTADQLTAAFDDAAAVGASELVLDLSGVRFVDSAGLRAIIQIERRARDGDRALRIVSPAEEVREVFRLSGVDEILPVVGGPNQAGEEYQYADRVVLELAVSPGAPRQARAELRDLLAGKLSDEDCQMALLLTSELVTNAVVHPAHPEGASIGLQISAEEGRLRVEVADSGQGFDPANLEPDERDIGGKGLIVVDRTAARWGTTRDDRFRVWFELAPAG
jgi:anti-anti-sigma factor